MFGMSITQSDGGLWMSPEFTPQNLINKGTMSASKGSVLKHQSHQTNHAFSS